MSIPYKYITGDYMINIGDKKYYTTKEISIMLGMHIRTIQGWVRDGKLIPFRFSKKKFYYDESSVIKCIEGKIQ